MLSETALNALFSAFAIIIKVKPNNQKLPVTKKIRKLLLRFLFILQFNLFILKL